MALSHIKDVKSIAGFDVAHNEKAKPSCFIYIDKPNNTISFKVQEGDTKEGVNGCQIDCLIQTARMMIEKANEGISNERDRNAVTSLNNASISLQAALNFTRLKRDDDKNRAIDEAKAAEVKRLEETKAKTPSKS